ncbi:MAG: hypothetical protein D4R67_02895 [Bacteroidetes bacterium]|nr:MAG: hypothetical protein D4R67_02895 [Bacteroidota bacterium]
MAPSEKEKEQWECLFASKVLYQTEILKSLLEECDIPAVTINKQDSSYLFGDIEVYVKRDDILRAQLILEKFLADE